MGARRVRSDEHGVVLCRHDVAGVGGGGGGGFFLQAEDGIRDLVRSRGLGDVYKRQTMAQVIRSGAFLQQCWSVHPLCVTVKRIADDRTVCLLYTSDAADERSSVDLGGRRIIKKKRTQVHAVGSEHVKTLDMI